MHHTFWYISVLSLHYYDFDISKFHVLWRMQTQFENLLFLFVNLYTDAKNSSVILDQQNLLTFDMVLKFQNKKFPTENSRNASAWNL